MKRETEARLREHGVALPPSRAPELRIAGTGKDSLPDLVEPQAVPLVNLSRAGLKDPDDQPCPACGRLASGFRALLMDADATLPEGVDLCRGRNNPAIYIVTERFANAIRELGLTGCVVRPFATP